MYINLGDGVTDVAVGGGNSVLICFLKDTGVVKSYQRISGNAGDFGGNSYNLVFSPVTPVLYST